MATLLLLVGQLGVTAVLATADKNYNAHLSGREEVPAVDTKAQGELVIHTMKDGAELHFKLNVANIDNVTAAHLHHGAAAENGPVVVSLFMGPATAGAVNGQLAEGTITAGSLAGPLAGKTLDDLAAEIAAGKIYVNVHTTAHPNGEIRGQVQ
jgi:hypothetical protein